MVEKTVMNKSSRDAVEVTAVVVLSSEVTMTSNSIKTDVSSETGLPVPAGKKRKEASRRMMDINAEASSSSKLKLVDSSSSNSSSYVILSGPQDKGEGEGEGGHIAQKLDSDDSQKASPSSKDDTSGETTAGFSSVDSTDLTKGDLCIEETTNKGQMIKSSMEQDDASDANCSLTFLHLCSSEKTDRSKDYNLPQHKPDDVFEFDLNEDLVPDDDDDDHVVWSNITKSVSVYHEIGASTVSEPIAVVAKVGVPVGLPRTPLQFDGELGWKRAATATATSSAFRPAEITENKIRLRPPSLSLFDLNIIAIGADNNNLAVQEYSSSVNDVAGSKQPVKFILDLNSESESHEDHDHPEPGVLQGGGFDLNDECVDDVCQTRQTNYTCPRTTGYWVDLQSAMPLPLPLPGTGFAQVQAQPFLVAAPGPQQMQAVVPLESKLAFAAAPTPPGSSRTNGLSAAMPMYSPPFILSSLSAGHQHHGAAAAAAALVPQISAVYPAPAGNVHLLDLEMSSAQRVISPSGLTNLRPSFVLTSLENFNFNHGANIKEFLVPGRTMLVDERHIKSVQQPLPVVLPPASMKRREQEGRSTIDGLSRGTRIV
ncbi:hypothetical protein Dimus_006739 [Dionaea muscipula]